MQTEAGKLYSDPSATLTDKGRAEAHALAHWLPTEGAELLLSSPSVRAQATADAIAARTGLAVEVIEHLREWQVGTWEGRSYMEIKKAEPDIYGAWVKDPIRNAPPEGESIEQLCVRARGSIQQLCEQFTGKTLAVVTHAEVIRAILVHALGMPVDNFWRLNVPTASVSKVDFSNNFATLQYMALKPA